MNKNHLRCQHMQHRKYCHRVQKMQSKLMQLMLDFKEQQIQLVLIIHSITTSMIQILTLLLLLILRYIILIRTLQLDVFTVYVNEMKLKLTYLPVILITGYMELERHSCHTYNTLLNKTTVIT